MWEHCHLCWFIFICFQSRFLLCSHFSICSHPWPLSPHSTSNPAKPRLALSLPCAQGLTVSPTASIIILLHSHLLPALFQQPPNLSLCFCPCPPKLLPCFPHSSQCDPFKTDSDHMSPFFQTVPKNFSLYPSLCDLPPSGSQCFLISSPSYSAWATKPPSYLCIQSSSLCTCSKALVELTTFALAVPLPGTFFSKMSAWFTHPLHSSFSWNPR